MSRLTALGEMASALAHEINQPLSAISNYLRGARRILQNSERALPPPVDDALQKAADQAIRAGEIIRRLREFVRTKESEKRVESLQKMIEEASALALVGAKEHGVSVTYDLSPDAEHVLADRVQVQQVLLNLIRNAMDAMDLSARRDLTISTRVDDGGMVRISVSDTGPGISPDVAGRLFQPFVTTKARGMGVGLSISRTISEAHGGRLWTEPNDDGGAVFHLTLQLASSREPVHDA
jgi:two-component system sensor kinase FixL